MVGIGNEPAITRLPALGGSLDMVVFDQLPLHDSTWGLVTGQDGLIYIAACGEHVGGLSVFMLSFDPVTGTLDYRLELGPALGQPPDDGHATQSKIHYCMIPGHDGLLYCATHASGPPLGDPWWSPWLAWYDPEKNFPGSHLFTFNPADNTVDDWGVALYHEGCRCLAYDEPRRTLYGVSWPRNHFFTYHVDSKTFTDIGRFGDINPQAVFLDKHGNAYTTDDYGRLLRYRPGSDDLETLSIRLPYEQYRRGWHNVLYDVVPSLDQSVLYGCDWGYESHLFRYDPYDGPEGRIDDLGRPPIIPEGFATDFGLEDTQIRGLVFGHDGKLYYTVGQSWKPGKPRILCRVDVRSGRHETVCELDYDGRKGQHIGSATMDWYGNLYFAEAGARPTRMFIYRPDDVSMDKQVFGFDDVKPWG